MVETQVKELLEAGVHFGHQASRWNPKMRKFIFAERNGIHIIDLQKTLRALEAARQVVREVTLEGERVLFVCTKRQLRAVIELEAARCGGFFVTERWLGGMLTNFATIKKQIRRLKDLERGIEDSRANKTRFVAIGREGAPPTGRDKTSLAFAVAHDRPGTLVSVLPEFSDRSINMTKIESRPSGEELGVYVFLIDIDGHRDDPLVEQALAAVREQADFFKVFGSYPAWFD